MTENRTGLTRRSFIASSAVAAGALQHRVEQRLIVFEKLSDVLPDALLLLPAEYFANFVVCFDEAVIVETDDADAVTCLFKQCAITLLTRTQLPLLTPHETE